MLDEAESSAGSDPAKSPTDLPIDLLAQPSLNPGLMDAAHPWLQLRGRAGWGIAKSGRK